MTTTVNIVLILLVGLIVTSILIALGKRITSGKAKLLQENPTPSAEVVATENPMAQIAENVRIIKNCCVFFAVLSVIGILFGLMNVMSR